jgi:cytochrome c-type biogenesis protein CcmH/NrfG
MSVALVEESQDPQESISENQNTPDNKSTDNKSTDNKSTDDAQGGSWTKYIFIGVLTVVLILLVYYGYETFIKNSSKETCTKGVEQERDDPVIDFNLREAIRDLQTIQKNVLSTLSQTMDF